MRRGSHLWTCCTLTNPLCERARTWQLDFYIDVYSRPIRHGFLRLRAASCGREVGVGLGNLQAGRSLARSFVRCNSLSFPPFFIYLFFFPFLSFFPFLFYSFIFYSILPFFPPPLPLFLYRSPSSPALLVSPVAAPLSTVHICFWGVVPVIEDRVWILFGFYCDALSNDGNEHSQSETGAYRSEEKWAFFGFFSFTIDIRSSVLGLVTLVRDRVKKKKREKKEEEKKLVKFVLAVVADFWKIRKLMAEKWRYKL